MLDAGSRTLWAVGAILVIALGLRLVAIGWPLSHDEGYTWLVASADGPAAFFDRLAAYENTPPLYYLLTWPLPDGGVAWLRLVSVLAGVGCVAAVWWTARSTFATHGGVNVDLASLLGAAAIAVAPFAVSYSDYARGFVLADLGLVVALGAAMRQRWGVYVAGAAVALYAEYDSALFLIAIAIAFRNWRLAAPVALLIPWLPFAQATDTKVAPIYPEPSFGSLRDTLVRLTFGEHGTANGLGLRWLQFLLVAAVCVWAFRKAPRAIGRVALWTLALHAVAHWAGPDVFAPRYLTELIPLAAIAIGCAIGADARGARMRLPVRGARILPVLAAACMTALAAACMTALAVAIVIQRAGPSDEPDYAAIAKQVRPSAEGRKVLTNSAVVVYYLRDLDPRLDRPFGLGPGQEAACAGRCNAPFLIVDDIRVANSPRVGPGRTRRFGPIYVRATPASTRADSR